MTDLSTLGKRLAYARSQTRPKLRQQDVADRIGASYVDISRWERDENTPRAERLLELANLYQVPLNWVMRGGPDPFNKRDVPRDTRVSEPKPSYGSREMARLRRAEQFEREMIRLGADDYEADHVRVRSRTFLESVLSHGGTEDLTDADLDRELELYLENNLRVWVIEHMKRRGAEPKLADEALSGRRKPR